MTVLALSIMIVSIMIRINDCSSEPLAQFTGTNALQTTTDSNIRTIFPGRSPKYYVELNFKSLILDCGDLLIHIRDIGEMMSVEFQGAAGNCHCQKHKCKFSGNNRLRNASLTAKCTSEFPEAVDFPISFDKDSLLYIPANSYSTYQLYSCDIRPEASTVNITLVSSGGCAAYDVTGDYVFGVGCEYEEVRIIGTNDSIQLCGAGVINETMVSQSLTFAYLYSYPIAPQNRFPKTSEIRIKVKVSPLPENYQCGTTHPSQTEKSDNDTSDNSHLRWILSPPCFVLFLCALITIIIVLNHRKRTHQASSNNHQRSHYQFTRVNGSSSQTEDNITSPQNNQTIV